MADIDVLLSWGTRRFGSVEVRHAPRADGKSNYTIRRLLRHAMTLMTAYSDLPLRLASYFGLLLALFGLGVLAWVLGRFLLHGSAVQGFTFLASIIAIFSGGQLLALGIMGEYLARMHFRLLDKPSYVIRRTPAFGGPDADPPAAP